MSRYVRILQQSIIFRLKIIILTLLASVLFGRIIKIVHLKTDKTLKTTLKEKSHRMVQNLMGQ